MKHLIVVLFLISLHIPSAHAQDNPPPEPQQPQQPPLPLELEPITAENIGHLTELTQLGRGLVRDVAWSPDGLKAAAASDTGIWIYDPYHADAPPELLVWASDIQEIVYAPSGQSILGRTSMEIKLWDAVSGREIRSLSTHLSIRTMAVDFESRLVAVAGGLPPKHSIQVWDFVTGRQLWSLLDHNTVLHLAFSPKQQRMASVHTDGQVQLWDIHQMAFALLPQSRFTISNQPTKIRPYNTSFLDEAHVAFSPDGTLLAAVWSNYQWGGFLHFWDVKRDRLITKVETDTNVIAFSTDGRYLIGSLGSLYDPDLSLWDITHVRRTGFMKRLFGGGSVSHAYTVLHEMSVEFMPRNNGIIALASAGDLFFVSFVEALHWRTFVAWHELNAGIKMLAFSQDGTTLIAERENGRTQTWNLQALKEKDGEAAHYAVFNDDVSSNDRWQAAFYERMYDSDPNIYVYDLKMSNSYRLKQYSMTGIAFSPNNRFLAASLDEYYYSYIRLWSLSDVENTLFDVPHQTISVRSRVTEIAFSADSNLVFAVGERFSLLSGYFGVYDIRSPEGNEVKMVNESASMNALAVSPDGRLLAYGGLDGVIHLMGVPSESLDDKAAQS